MRVEREKLFLSKLNKEVFFELLTLGMERRLEEEIGLVKLNEALTLDNADTANESILIILKAAWILLSQESKKEILRIKFMDIDDNGEDVEIKFNRPEEKFLNCVTGKEMIGVAMAIVKLSQKSMPEIQETAKKKVTVEQS